VSSRFSGRLVLLACAAIWPAFVPSQAWAQATDPQVRETPNQEDPTKALFFSIRNEFFNLDGGDWTNALIFRSDRAVLRTHPRLGGKAGLLTRFDVPIVTADLGGSREAGLGDLYAQAIYVPWLTRRFAVAAGTGLGAPTATDQMLGTGKWKVAPLVAPVWFFPRRHGLFLVRFHGHRSFAGDDERRDINYLEVAPLFIWNVRPRWWTLFDTITQIDWDAGNRVSRRSGIEIGRVATPRWGVAVKTEIPWGQDRRGDWKVICFLTRYRPN
jgi:hypothetical protein